MEVFRPGRAGVVGGVVVWCGTPGGRDDAALVRIDDDPRWEAPRKAVRWGRLVTDDEPVPRWKTWGVPDVAQRPATVGSQDATGAGMPVEAVQLVGQVNPGTGFVGNHYVMDLRQHPPQWSSNGTSPWAGMSGAAVFCDRLLMGVVASDRAHSGHSQFNVVPAYVLFHDSAFRAALAEVTGLTAGLEAAEFQSLADTAATTGAGPLLTPARLLEAGQQTVPFHGRTELLERLKAWSAQEGFGAWLLHGPGGQGKTRLAHHFGHLLAADEWAVLWPRRGVTPDQLLETRHAAKPLLIVLDYAETRTDQLTAIVEATAQHCGSTAFKVLLLARTHGDWWAEAQIDSRLSDLLPEVPSHRLELLEHDPADRPQAYRRAVWSLAAALPRVIGCADTDWWAAAGSLSAPGLDQDGYGNALTLHMTALADLLDTATPAGSDDPSPTVGVDGRTGGGIRQVAGTTEGAAVEDRLLDHESRYWKRTAKVRGLEPGLGFATLKTAMAAAHLVGAADLEQADRTWRGLRILADQTRDRRNAVTAWIGTLYPPADDDKQSGDILQPDRCAEHHSTRITNRNGAGVDRRPWGGLQPDRLAERHIGRTLEAHPDLVDELLREADEPQIVQLLTVYSRAAAHPVFDGRLDVSLTNLCVRHSHRLAAQIVTTAVRTDHPAPLIAALDTLSADPAASLADLTALYRRFPDLSRRLASTAARLAQSITSRYLRLAGADPNAYQPALAASLHSLSARLEAVGQRGEALTAIREAVGHYRRLAGVNPDSYLANLAVSLNSLSARLGAMGQRGEALTAIREAVGHYRRLAEAAPDSYLPDLVASLNNQSVWSGEVGRWDEALTAIREAVGHYRKLAEAAPDAYLAHLAASLHNLSNGLGKMGQREGALTAIREAVEIRRRLVEAAPDAYLPDLAASLHNLSNGLGESGQREGALTAIREAVEIRRRLVEAAPDAYLPDLAVSLNLLSVWLGVERREEALIASWEAVGHYRRLVEAASEAYLPDLADSLNNLSVWLGAAGRRGRA
ncbi:tetratricopeptide repeat protein [Streptomyces sp. NPDC001935]